MASESPGRDNAMPSQGVRSVISLVLFIHLFCIVLAVIANFAPSQLELRLLHVFSPYTELANLDVTQTPFYLTHGTIDDVDHRVEVLPVGGDSSNDDDWIRLPGAGFRGGERYKRYQRLASYMARFVESEEAPALIARSVAQNFVSQQDIEPQRVRCRKHLLQHWSALSSASEADRDAFSPQYFNVAYDCEILINEDGTVSIKKIESAAQSASPDTSQQDNEPRE